MKSNSIAYYLTFTIFLMLNLPANAAEPKVDFNGDGRADVLLRNIFTGQIDSWLSNGNGGQKISYGTASPNDGWTLISTGDFNGDGRTDLLWYNTQTGGIATWFVSGNSIAGGVSYGTVPISSKWGLMSVGDFNGDGRTDLLWYKSDTGDIVAWLINGGAMQGVSYGTVPPSSRWILINTGDFNGDGRTDLLWYKSDTGDIVAWLINGGAMQGVSYGTVPPSTGWVPVGKGDFNGDGRTDLLWYNVYTGANSALLINANGSGVQASVPYPAIPLNSGLIFIGSGDFNNDGRTDLLWYNGYTGQISAWLINGGSVAGASYGSVLSNTGWTPVGLDDFNGDGTTDIFWFNRSTYQAAAWFINGSSLQGSASYGTVTPSSVWQVQIPSQPSQ